MDELSLKNLCARLLNYYQEADDATAESIEHLKVYKSPLYSLGPVYNFVYHNRSYYVVDDYSLDDDPHYIKQILEEINNLIKGAPVRNPHPQSDGALYASGMNGIEYYLWRVN